LVITTRNLIFQRNKEVSMTATINNMKEQLLDLIVNRSLEVADEPIFKLAFGGYS